MYMIIICIKNIVIINKVANFLATHKKITQKVENETYTS